MKASASNTTDSSALRVKRYTPREVRARLDVWRQFVTSQGCVAPSHDPQWLVILQNGLKQVPYVLEVQRAGAVVGYLPLLDVRSVLFGRFLVSVPYLNTGGVIAVDDAAATTLVDHAVELADELDVRHLELRHEKPLAHPAFNYELTSKVHMRLDLPATADELWKQFDPKVRNQIRKGEKCDLSVHWGGERLVADFYAVFSRNMRDLGTPVFSRCLFLSMLRELPQAAEICVVRHREKPVAAAILLHGAGVTEVPSASTLREYNTTNANMLMYWHLLQRAIQRGQHTFDFGRSSEESNTYRFKKQWGAHPEPAHWQYYLRKGAVSDMRPDSARNQRLIRLWQKLPLWAANLCGPPIVRGIP